MFKKNMGRHPLVKQALTLPEKFTPASRAGSCRCFHPSACTRTLSGYGLYTMFGPPPKQYGLLLAAASLLAWPTFAQSLKPIPAPSVPPAKMTHSHTNLLAKEHSPYLLQHQHNPVDWQPWGETAFAQARREDKPILLSIGYSTCHWCHVMERESFEDPKLAEYLNAHFISIKVDREERPDVDKIYMTAVQAMGLGGGWPLNAFLTPDLKPFLNDANSIRSRVCSSQASKKFDS